MHHFLKDSIIISSLKEKYNKNYVINLRDRDLQLRVSEFPDLLPSKKANLSELNQRLKNEALSIWGLNVMEIYPKSKKDYIHETIYLKNTSFTTRRAVIEQIISNLDPTEIRNILDEMEEYQNRLDGIEMTEYQMYSKDTRELLENLLK